MGSAPGQMGLSELRSRAAELRRTLDELARVLALRPEALLWNDVLEKFSVAGVQAGALAAACDRRSPLASAYAAHPVSVSALNAAALPVMLSTAPLPEAVAERSRRVAEAVAAVRRAAASASAGGMEIDNENDNDGGEGEKGEEEEEKTLELLGAAAASVNALVDSLTASSGALLDAKSRERRALLAEAHALAAPPPPPPPKGSAGGPRPGGAAAAVSEDPKARLVSRALLGRLV